MNAPRVRPEPGLPLKRERRGHSANALTNEQLQLIFFLMGRRKIKNPATLAARLGEDPQNVRKWFAQSRGVTLFKRARLAQELGITPDELAAAAATLARLQEAKRNPNGDEKVTSAEADRGNTLAPEGFYSLEHGDRIDPPPGGMGRWLIYDGTGIGNPMAPDESARPIVVDRVDLDREKVALLGRRGFGIRVRGESLSMWEIHANDVVWINPDARVLYNRPNLFLFRQGGIERYALKVLKHNGTEDYLVDDGDEGPGQPIPLADVTPLGPVVLHDRSSVPRRRDILQDQANLVDRVRKPIPLPGADLDRAG